MHIGSCEYATEHQRSGWCPYPLKTSAAVPSVAPHEAEALSKYHAAIDALDDISEFNWK